MQHIVFNGHYLMYFDTAVAGYWRALAMPYHDTMAQLQGDLYVRKATLEYEGSARYDEQLNVGVRCGRIGTSSMVMHAAVFRGQTRLVHGELVYVFADPTTQTSRPVPASLRAVLQAFEAGADMAPVRVGSWADLGGDAQAVCDAARLPKEAPNGQPETTLCAVAHNHFGVAVATARLQRLGDAHLHITHWACLPTLRGAGFGKAVLQALLAAVDCNAQPICVQPGPNADPSHLAFFKHLGFAPSAGGIAVWIRQ
jgi:YbgC/YbaW family acyl-CoA thioester hydrolase